MTSLDLFCQENIEKLREEKKLRSLKDFTFQSDLHITWEGKKYLNFASNDYYGLAANKEVCSAAKQAIDAFGVGGTSSRLVVGNYSLYGVLERNLAAYKNTESSVVFGSGYLASISLIPALFDKNDLIITDKLIHACLLDAVKLSGAKLIRFAHNDVNQAEAILQEKRKEYKKAVIITETVFSMDGGRGKVDELIDLARKYNSYVITDDAHGIGLNEAFDSYENHIQMGTLSKGIGAYGGYVAGSKSLCTYLASKARGLIYTTSLPVPVVAAAIKALELLKTDSNIIAKLKENINILSSESGLDNSQTPIFVKEYGSIEKMQEARNSLLERGFYVADIRPPTSRTARLRISVSGKHKREDLSELGRRLKSI